MGYLGEAMLECPTKHRAMQKMCYMSCTLRIRYGFILWKYIEYVQGCLYCGSRLAGSLLIMY